MNKAKRAAVIAGNWKMNKSRAEAKALVEELLPLVKDADCGVIVCTTARPGFSPRPARPTTWVSMEKVFSGARYESIYKL